MALYGDSCWTEQEIRLNHIWCDWTFVNFARAVGRLGETNANLLSSCWLLTKFCLNQTASRQKRYGFNLVTLFLLFSLTNGKRQHEGRGNYSASNTSKSEVQSKAWLWEQDRSERELWKAILQNGPSVVYSKRKELLRAKDDELMQDLNDLLQGHILTDSKWRLPTREIAVFLSSTFTDMTVERDLLMEDVYPYLREFCRRLGYNFSVADMRCWVRDEMTDEHQAVEICVAEVQRCRSVL